MHKLMIAAMADASLTHFQRLGHRGQWDACTDCLQRPDSARSFQLLPDCPICQEPMEWLVRKSQELQIYILYIMYTYSFCSFWLLFSLFDILSLAKSTARATINRCQQPSLCWQVEWLQRRLLHQWLGLQQQLWIKVGPTRLENGTENGTENGGDILRPFDSRTFTMRMAGLWI